MPLCGMAKLNGFMPRHDLRVRSRLKSDISNKLILNTLDFVKEIMSLSRTGMSRVMRNPIPKIRNWSEDLDGLSQI